MENLDPFSPAQIKEVGAFWRSRNLRIQPSLLSPEGRGARSDICIRRLAFVRFHGGCGSAFHFPLSRIVVLRSLPQDILRV